MNNVVEYVTRPGGIEIPYTVLGSGAPPRLVFAHALTGSGLLTGPEGFAPFLDAGWSVATIDQRGHGEATPTTDPGHYRVNELGTDLIAVLDDLGWPSGWLCGASMGAAPAICAAVASPNRVDGLLLLAPAFGDESNAAADMFARIATALADGGIEAGEEAWRQEMEARGLGEEGLEQQLAQLRLHDPGAMAVWLREIGAWTIPEELRQLPTVDVPVVAVAWEGDDIHPANLARHIAKAQDQGLCEVVDLTKAEGPDFLFRAGFDALGRLRDAHEDQTPGVE